MNARIEIVSMLFLVFERASVQHPSGQKLASPNSWNYGLLSPGQHLQKHMPLCLKRDEYSGVSQGRVYEEKSVSTFEGH